MVAVLSTTCTEVLRLPWGAHFTTARGAGFMGSPSVVVVWRPGYLYTATAAGGAGVIVSTARVWVTSYAVAPDAPGHSFHLPSLVGLETFFLVPSCLSMVVPVRLLCIHVGQTTAAQ